MHKVVPNKLYIVVQIRSSEVARSKAPTIKKNGNEVYECFNFPPKATETSIPGVGVNKAMCTCSMYFIIE